MARAVRIDGFHEVTFAGHEPGQTFARQFAALGVEGRLFRVTRHLFEFDDAVERGDVSDRQPGQIRLIVGAVRLAVAGITGRHQVPGRSRQEEVVFRITPRLDEIHGTLEHGQVAGQRLFVAADEKFLCLEHHAGGGELHAPVVHVGFAVALPVNDAARRGGVAERAVGRHPVELSDGRAAAALAVAHLLEPHLVRILDEAHEGLAQQRQRGVSGAVTVLDPPHVPSGPLVHAVPARRVKHGKVLELRIGLHHARGDVEQLQVLDVALAPVMLTIKRLSQRQADRE